MFADTERNPSEKGEVMGQRVIMTEVISEQPKNADRQSNPAVN